jgi:predicted HAD superfamily Cof-like phosphohydrolase
LEGSVLNKMLTEFHEKFGLHYHGPPRPLEVDLRGFRVNFMHEELTEYIKACFDRDLEKQLDALVDLIYVAAGTAYLQGFDLDEAFRRVHLANMRKVKATSDEQSTRGNGKFDIIKPPGWTPPDLSDLVRVKP